MSVALEEMNVKRTAEPTPGGTGKKRKKEVMVEFSGAVTEEILKKQVAEAWSRRTPFSHGNLLLRSGGRRAMSGGPLKVPALVPSPGAEGTRG